MFVPQDAQVKWKKDRLGTILQYATQLVERYTFLKEFYDRNMHAGGEQLTSQQMSSYSSRSKHYEHDEATNAEPFARLDGGHHQEQGQFLSRHGELATLADHLVTHSNTLHRTLGDVEPGLRQQRNNPMDDKTMALSRRD